MSTTSNPADIDAVRAALGADYDILEELGRGGMAIVYRARERDLDREVAIKVLPAQFAFDESFVERFQREGRIAAQLEHPHVVPIHRVGRSGHVVYFAMKLLRGQSLSERLHEKGRLPTAEVRRMLLETASALGYAAKRGVVHRDIKPDNIMLDEDGRCVVTDFGIARSAAQSKLTATGMAVGTPRYMSPEQARASSLDGRSDIYSLGVVGYECLVGTTPFDGEDAFAILMAHINDPLPRPALVTDEERAIFQVIERMLAKNPQQRFQSAEEVVAALLSPAPPSGWAPDRPVVATSPTVVSSGMGAESSDRSLDSQDSSGPQASAALDRALDVGLDLLRQQKPKLEAGLRALQSQRPRVNAGLATSRTAFSAQIPRLVALRKAIADRGSQARAYVSGRSRRFWGTSVAASMAVVVLYYGIHFATKHRSQCPAVASTAGPAPAGGPDTGLLGTTGAQPFSVLLEAVKARKPGQNVELYYDVCGLERGAGYTTAVRVSRNESGLRRILGGSSQPVTLSFDARASGPAARHHETIDFSDMPPGSYSLALTVTDAGGRRREKISHFQVLNP